MKDINLEEIKKLVIGHTIVDMHFCEESGKMKFVLDNGNVVFCRYYWSAEYFGTGIINGEEEFEMCFDGY